MPRPTFVVTGSISVTTTKVGAFQITTPATGVPILLNPTKLSSSKDNVIVTLLEDYSFTDGLESALTPLDIRRADPSEAADTAVKAYVDITAVAGAGALTLDSYSFAAASDSVSVHNSFVLKPNTTYLLAITNSNANTAVCKYTLSFTEVH